MTIRTQTCHLPAQNAGFSGFLTRIVMAHSTWRQRQVLDRLDNSALNDIGISRDQARKEAQKPVWDVPAHWRR